MVYDDFNLWLYVEFVVLDYLSLCSLGLYFCVLCFGYFDVDTWFVIYGNAFVFGFVGLEFVGFLLESILWIRFVLPLVGIVNSGVCSLVWGGVVCSLARLYWLFACVFSRCWFLILLFAFLVVCSCLFRFWA